MHINLAHRSASHLETHFSFTSKQPRPQISGTSKRLVSLKHSPLHPLLQHTRATSQHNFTPATAPLVTLVKRETGMRIPGRTARIVRLLWPPLWRMPNVLRPSRKLFALGKRAKSLRSTHSGITEVQLERIYVALGRMWDASYPAQKMTHEYTKNILMQGPCILNTPQNNTQKCKSWILQAFQSNLFRGLRYRYDHKLARLIKYC